MWNKSTVRSGVATACTLFACSALSAQTARLDACSVLTRDEIKTLSGNHDHGPPEPGANSQPDVVTICYWERTSPKGSVSLWYKVSPDEPKGLGLQKLLDHGKKARAVAGLGDDAVFLESPKEDPGGTLFVRVGHYRVSIYREADHPTATSESVLPLLTAFAKAAVPKLRKAG